MKDKNLENKTVNPYDLVKIKVILDDNYYIFSRYLISRMLALICVKWIYIFYLDQI